jgi:glycosyltransferase involved in cell wall biosynthesis
MHILIDGNTLENDKAGIGHYTYNLIQELAEILGVSDKLYVGIRQKLLDKNIELGIKRVPVIKTTERSFSKYMPFSPRWMRGFDIYHQPNYIPHAFHGKIVTTVHDMSHRVFPQYHPRRRVILLRAFENRLRQATRIITVSEHARGEIVELLGVSEEKVTVTYEGAGSQYRPLSISEEKRMDIKNRYKLPERFLLYVGTIEPRKNLERLIEAYYLYKGGIT